MNGTKTNDGRRWGIFLFFLALSSWQVLSLLKGRDRVSQDFSYVIPYAALGCWLESVLSMGFSYFSHFFIPLLHGRLLMNLLPFSALDTQPCVLQNAEHGLASSFSYRGRKKTHSHKSLSTTRHALRHGLLRREGRWGRTVARRVARPLSSLYED